MPWPSPYADINKSLGNSFQEQSLACQVTTETETRQKKKKKEKGKSKRSPGSTTSS
jgi:hypothetical protein